MRVCLLFTPYYIAFVRLCPSCFLSLTVIQTLAISNITLQGTPNTVTTRSCNSRIRQQRSCVREASIRLCSGLIGHRCSMFRVANAVLIQSPDRRGRRPDKTRQEYETSVRHALAVMAVMAVMATSALQVAADAELHCGEVSGIPLLRSAGCVSLRTKELVPYRYIITFDDYNQLVLPIFFPL
ncbi:hypothetical protein BDV26DRAFT_263498 [Aspergillus bertholletiae]|uniref:Uncharacterized protein n=1 Tax=Aspergillus bertholletiae TaxID=1226010 RepID=A0A5N7B790_9EURO|nr:hypothetical protein BDV26DRAFT_263498 [Aspergillus bertholletiae]